MAIELAITAETLPEGACSLITSEQERLNLYADYMKASFPGTITGLEIGDTAPTDFEKAWLKLDNLGRPERIYYYANGLWLALHPTLPGMTIIWVTTLPDLDTYDGGSAGAVTAYSGPMWEEVTDLAGRVPVGAGTLQPSGTVVAVTDTGGEDEHTLTTAEMPEHSHSLANETDGAGNGQLAVGESLNVASNQPGGDRAYSLIGQDYDTNLPVRGLTSKEGTGNPHENMPPYFTVHFIKRTNRLFYRGA